MNLDQALQTFIAESRELLEQMEDALLSLGHLQDDDATSEAVNAIFRAAHTIKGSSGLFGLDAIVEFTHVVESVLDEVRAGRIPVDPTLVALLLGCGDHIGALVAAVDAGGDAPDPALVARGKPLCDQLCVYLGGTGRAHAAAEATAQAEPAAGEAENWHISVRFGTGVLRNGMDPLAFIRYLGTLGRITRLVTLDDALPEADEMDAECCYLGFEIALHTTADKAAIEAVFEFVLDDCQLRILAPQRRIDEVVALIRSLPESPERLGEILVRCGTVTAHELARALQTQASEQPSTPIGRILVEQNGVPPAVVDAALDKQQRSREARSTESQSIRVDAAKLDQLIDQVGELIIAAAGANLAARAARDAELVELNSAVSQLVEQVRDSALQLRMVKIGATFNRFQRVVHDVARELGKDIALEVSGEDTELDKTVVERIGDPLTHLVRNSMDHGIEPAELRAERGKPARGVVRLNAFHDSGSIVIEVSDDGGGLNREKILAKAVERGLVEPGKVLSDGEIYNLIFEPGFSTAEQVTNLSGRGVGMDVVKRNITALRGSVDIGSRPGEGTTVTVRLPLTLAIIEGFQLAIGKAVFVVPLDVVEECVEYEADAGNDYTDLRGEVLPLIRLRELFELGGEPGRRQNIVVVRHGSQKVGLVVDTLLGEFQTVIKPLSKMFAQVKGISGSSIRGSGDVALILDVPALVGQALNASHRNVDRPASAAGAQPASHS
ncbi:chemotaxis protein CheA [Aquincola sp. MAHUQ-54]|uniref:Chemotaxis protein CheA n=1 Tax=Aquincola agrisoli TaxID=3119538 RepID=A0AAW9QLP8_9BURK